MLAGEPGLYTGFPISVRKSNSRNRPDAAVILGEIRAGFPAAKRARVRNRNSIVYLSVPQVADKWAGGRSNFGVPDLHYVGTRFDRRLDTTALNDFNLLPRGVHPFQSQDSLVISSCGTFTDSHSDDHAGSNHCFAGSKLWLMWDTLEGFRHGLEDVERCEVTDRAKFDMPQFLRMKSSRWLVIGPGQTMFIPANLTHKVITLEHYLGLGSFHAGFPSLVDALLHWARLPPLWARNAASPSESSVEHLARRAARKLRALGNADAAERARWGVPSLGIRLARLGASKEAASTAARDPNVQRLVRALERF